MRRVVVRRKRVRHGVVDAQAHVGEAHAGDVLGERHAFTAARGHAAFRFGHRVAQVLRDELDRLQVEHVGKLPRALGGVTLNRVCERVHAGGGGEACGHGRHHFGVDYGNFRNVVHVDADEFALLFRVGNHVIDGDFGCGAGGGGHGNGEYGMLGGGSDAFKAYYVGELGVRGNDANALRGIHGAAAAHGHDAIGAAGLERCHARLHVFDGGVRLDVAEHLPRDARFIEHVGYLFRDAEAHQVGVGCHKYFRELAAGDFAGNFLNCACSVIRNVVQNEAIRHSCLLVSTGCRCALRLRRVPFGVPDCL